MTGEEKAKAQLVIVTGLLVIYFIFGSRFGGLLIAAAIIGVLCIAIPKVGDLIVRGWYKIAEILGAINGKILLSILFFIILLPVALLSRLGRKDPLAIKKDPKESMFVRRDHRYVPKDFENVW